MDARQRQRIVDKHSDSFTRFGYHPNALYWSGRDIQELRFKVLAYIGIQAHDAVLDVGCGFGDLYTWSKANQCPLDYTGIDLSPDLLDHAQECHPDATFFTGDLFDLETTTNHFDWVVLSGALNEQLHDDSAYAYRIIRRMYQLCKKGVAFNMLDARHINAHDLHSQQPSTVIKFCQTLSKDVTLYDTYLQNDFTIHIQKNN
ncbi:MAG TPA: class I SAM-dependent methyltransferase [Ghiorsea sp.]|nr:class I SAM-dependent methyltransferase [Ghiorsea sp.]HIP07304.1 class I SAM-dependent methyltransferase [Mariprofundaceae bacterium]